jgi:putative hydrolase of the HAD superfamily
MRRTLVWDVGSVVIWWKPEILVRQKLGELVASPPDLATWMDRIFQGFALDSDWSLYDRGELSLEELAARIHDRTGLPRATALDMLRSIPARLNLLTDTVSLIHRARDAGHRTVYLSNMPVPYTEVLLSNPGFTGCFDDGVFSGLVKEVKPEPEIYRIAQESLGLVPDPEHTVFIDDRAVNLAPATARGWGTLHFVDAAGCATELERRGWL